MTAGSGKLRRLLRSLPRGSARCGEVVALEGGSPLGSGPYHARFQQTMLRIKDPKVTIPFYEENFGMKLIHWIAFPQWNFTVYFMERPQEGKDLPPECTLEATSVENEKYLMTMDGATLEFTHNHGAETDVWGRRP